MPALCYKPWQDLREDQETEISPVMCWDRIRALETLVQLMATRLQEGYTVLITAASLTQARHIQICSGRQSLAEVLQRFPICWLAWRRHRYTPSPTLPSEDHPCG
jgi:hypothetical protein